MLIPHVPGFAGIAPMQVGGDDHRGTKRKTFADADGKDNEVREPLAKRARIGKRAEDKKSEERKLNVVNLTAVLDSFNSSDGFRLGALATHLDAVAQTMYFQEKIRIQDKEKALDYFLDDHGVDIYVQNCACKTFKPCDCPAKIEESGMYKRLYHMLRVCLRDNAPPKIERAAKLVYQNEEYRHIIRREWNTLKLFQNNGAVSRISECFHVDVTNGILYLKFYDRGGLASFMKEHPYATHQADYHQFFLDILTAFSNLEKADRIPFDFSENNVMINEEEKRLRAVLIDMQHMSPNNKRMLNMFQDDHLTAYKRRLYPPEYIFGVLKRKDCVLNEKYNIWLLAMMVYEIMFSTDQLRLELPTNQLARRFQSLATFFLRMQKTQFGSWEAGNKPWLSDDRFELEQLFGGKPESKSEGISDFEEWETLKKSLIGIKQEVDQISVNDFVSSWGKELHKNIQNLNADLASLEEELERLDKKFRLVQVDLLESLLNSIFIKLDQAWNALSNLETSDPIQQVLCRCMIHPHPKKRKSATELIPIFSKAMAEYEAKHSGAGSGAGSDLS